jgi:N-carbamoylputrescine amidase
MKSSSFRLGLVQMSCSADAPANLEKAATKVREAAARGAQIICLQELFRTPYFCQREDPAIFDLAEAVPGPTTELFARIAKEAGVVVVASVFERRAPGLHHNTAVVIDADGSIAGLYRKMHIPDDPLYYEKYYFAPGDLGFRAFPTRFGKVGTLVCWDQWYPEAARLTAMQGADVLVYPTAIGWHPAEKAQYGASQHAAWETMQRSHAIANGVFVAAVNRVGLEKDQNAGLEFWGGSFVADPSGVLLAKGSHDREEVLVVECDPKQSESVRRNWPFFRDRRIDAYEGLTRRWAE